MLRVLVALASALAMVAADPFVPSVVSPQSISQVSQLSGFGFNATMHAVQAAGYSEPIYVLNISAVDHYSAGLGYALLLTNQSVENLEALFNSILPEPWERDVIEVFLEWQYTEYLVKGLPQSFLDEMRGLDDGARSVLGPDAGSMLSVYRYGITLSSIATGGLGDDILYLLLDEFRNRTSLMARLEEAGVTPEQAVHRILASPLLKLGHTCSMFGAWGARTSSGDLFSGRNLDWTANSGVAKWKVITVYQIYNTHAYASISFAGVTGAITGMSKPGLTVHEAGCDSKFESLEGFVWSFRLRALMEQASNLVEARAFWSATNNTLGINHGIGSGQDAAFMALETRAGYTAYFYANDTREASSPYGEPLPNALWRTNHAYDPEFLASAVDPTPGKDTLTRYKLIHDIIVEYEAAGVEISFLEAVNITAIVGDKGGSSRESFLSCAQAAGGINIVSATFHPVQQTMYVAFENTDPVTGIHVPACCNNYVALDMSMFW